MSALIFVDTNVLVYALDASQGLKHVAARRWLEVLWHSQRGRLSVQVLQECYVTLTRKLRPGLSPADARREVESYLPWSPVVIAPSVLQRAWLNEQRFSLSWWDALIVAAAQASGARYLLTEDLQTGQELDGVRVISPFTHTLQELDAS